MGRPDHRHPGVRDEEAHFDADEARAYLDRKDSQGETLQGLKAQGVATDGSYFDQDELVVMMQDRDADVAADSPSLRSIAPDLKGQQVVATLAPDAPASLEESLRSITGVTVESGPALSATADVVPGRIMDLDPGTNYSLGFPGTTSDGNNVLLTAGHCIEGLPDILDENGTKIGRGVDSRFVSGQVGGLQSRQHHRVDVRDHQRLRRDRELCRRHNRHRPGGLHSVCRGR